MFQVNSYNSFFEYVLYFRIYHYRVGPSLPGPSLLYQVRRMAFHIKYIEWFYIIVYYYYIYIIIYYHRLAAFGIHRLVPWGSPLTFPLVSKNWPRALFEVSKNWPRPLAKVSRNWPQALPIFLRIVFVCSGLSYQDINPANMRSQPGEHDYWVLSIARSHPSEHEISTRRT